MPEASISIGEHIQSAREAMKQAVPQLVHVARLGRLTLNQLKFPISAAILDWQGRVQVGPFTGIRFPRSGTGNFAEVLGSYEISLVPVLEQVIARKPDLIIDVGAAWGFYSMGLAMRCPYSRVIAYEMDRTRFDLMQKYNRINKLSHRIDMRGECTVATLTADLRDTHYPFILMDVEGAEDYLLQPHIASIDRGEILVELHEGAVPGITERMESLFDKSHLIQVIQQDDLSNYHPPPDINPFVRWQWSRLVKEDRKEPMTWMHLLPRLGQWPDGGNLRHS